ncbi:ABC transporter permease [Planosporangium sp. 12N6]|uniref:ABC transporter permease n=1 Tax=Planosporangium spinosum TaxID=3402278 RepID=UPI003CEF2A94
MSFLAQSAAANPWFSWAYLRMNADTIRTQTLEHLSFTVEAVALAVLVGVPLAVLAYWVRPLTGPILASAGVLYTIPSLALFAFLAPFLGTGRRTPLTGLVAYALLMVIRSTLTGLSQVPADVKEAASAMGYGRLRRLLRVELPLALPGLLTGVRLATVSTVALVTVGVLVGRGGLGQLIIGGFRNNYYKAEIATGAVLCVALAVVLDLLLVGVGRMLTPWRRRRSA